MILECPACNARYLVQIGLFAQGGRLVRCARCKHAWHFKLPTTVDVVETPPAQEPLFSPASPPPSSDYVSPAAIRAAVEAAAASAEPRMSEDKPPPVANLPALIKPKAIKKGLKHAAQVLLILMVVLAWPVLDRNRIVKVAPGLKSVYELFGLHIKHTGEGLTFEKVKSELRYDSGTMRLYVDGVIRNTTSEVQLIPAIRANALTPDRDVTLSWQVDTPAPTLAPGGEAPFHTEINAPSQRTIDSVFLEFYERVEIERPEIEVSHGGEGH